MDSIIHYLQIIESHVLIFKILQIYPNLYTKISIVHNLKLYILYSLNM